MDNLELTSTCAGDTGHGYIHMTVTANKLEGAEIITFRKTDYYYGLYEARMKLSSVPGVVDAFFWQSYPNDGQTVQEIDIEFLTKEFTSNSGSFHAVVHPRGDLGYFDPRHQQIPQLDFNPAADFHVYGFHWTYEELNYYVDGELVASFKRSEGSPVPDRPGRIFLNCWTGSPNWGGGPPTEDATMVIDWVKYWPESDVGISAEYISQLAE